MLFAEVHGAAAGAQQHTDFALLFHAHGRQRIRIKACGLQRFARRGNGHGHGAGDVLAFVRVHPGEFVEIFQFAGNVHRQFLGIEAGDVGHTAFARQKRAAKLSVPQTVRT